MPNHDCQQNLSTIIVRVVFTSKSDTNKKREIKKKSDKGWKKWETRKKVTK